MPIDAPENTLLAFLKALAIGVPYLETDVHVSRDGVAIISHDADLLRLTGRNERVIDLSVAELKLIRLGQDQTFATLAEALDAFPEARFNIDIKVPEAVGPTVAAIRRARAVDRVLVTSFNGSRRRSAVAQLPGVATSASAGGVALALVLGKIGLIPLLRRALRNVHAVQVPERALGMTFTTPLMLARLHRVGVEMHVWTINDPADMRRLLDLGVDGIMSDRADLAMIALAES
ncbi:glycerophosphodiester phosphodiesterase [Glaciihabitans sp. dw_435]|uniref:glycerophosphodiester phosphodiesterase n=1 Tax=Glaciihabitans sp. dw_435 TaxID=2720081 RepID=UPI001C49D717|nr:glycerophosphodiester phosphodiesterase [Glaciihabitans sp. dw_435]